MISQQILKIFPIINYSLKNYPENFSIIKYFFLLLFLSCLVSQFAYIYWQLNHIKVDCQTEILAGMITFAINAILTALSGIYFTFKGRSILKSFLTKITSVISDLNLILNTNISLQRQNRATNFSVVALSLYLFTYLTLALSASSDLRLPVFESLVIVLCVASSAWQMALIWFFIIIECVSLSILTTQTRALIRVEQKWNFPYANLCVNVFDQSMMVNEIFGITALTSVIQNLGNIILSLWSRLHSETVCMMGNYQYIFVICCMFSVAIVESGHKTCSEVSNFSLLPNFKNLSVLVHLGLKRWESYQRPTRTS